MKSSKLSQVLEDILDLMVRTLGIKKPFPPSVPFIALDEIRQVVSKKWTTDTLGLRFFKDPDILCGLSPIPRRDSCRFNIAKRHTRLCGLLIL